MSKPINVIRTTGLVFLFGQHACGACHSPQSFLENGYVRSLNKHPTPVYYPQRFRQCREDVCFTTKTAGKVQYLYSKLRMSILDRCMIREIGSVIENVSAVHALVEFTGNLTAQPLHRRSGRLYVADIVKEVSSSA